MTAQTFRDRQAPKYARKTIAGLSPYEQELWYMTAMRHPTDRVLEIFCGTGGTARQIAPLVEQVTATDLTAGMIGVAMARSGGSASVAPSLSAT